MGRCAKGTFNVELVVAYVPPDEAKYRLMACKRGTSVGRYQDGNHISPRSRVVSINDQPVTAWIYRGGHRAKPILELLSKKELAPFLGAKPGDELRLEIEEVAEGSLDMPKAPPANPGKKALSLKEQKGIYDNVGEAVKVETARYLCQILLEWQGRHPVSGSGIGLRIGSSYFILTAAHVLKDATLTSLWMFHGPSRVEDRVKAVHMGRRGGEKHEILDVGFLEVAEKDAKKLGLAFLSLDRLSKDLTTARDNLVMVNGFPNKTIQQVGDGIHTKALLYITVLEHEEDWHDGADPTLEIEVDYPESVPEIDATAPVNLPDAPGMSGGGLWESNPGRQDEIWSGRMVKLLGINTVWSPDGRWVRANRVENHLKLIAEEYPHLKEHLVGWI
jgi:hypothetical protein